MCSRSSPAAAWYLAVHPHKRPGRASSCTSPIWVTTRLTRLTPRATSRCSPRQDCIDRNDFTYTADFDSHRVEKLTTLGGALGKFTAGPNTLIESPYDLTFDAAGNLYVTSSFNGGIEEYSPTGDPLMRFTPAGPARG